MLASVVLVNFHELRLILFQICLRRFYLWIDLIPFEIGCDTACRQPKLENENINF